jgi:hypothetical protein
MGLSPEASLAAILGQRHVCCDCEIIFNLGATSGSPQHPRARFLRRGQQPPGRDAALPTRWTDEFLIEVIDAKAGRI